MAKEIVLDITNKKGLHARAAAKFVNTVNAYESDVQVIKVDSGSDSPVSGSSILGLMMLGAEPGSKLHIVVSGVDEDRVVAALTELLAAKFGEE